jgi:hypothetical protein
VLGLNLDGNPPVPGSIRRKHVDVGHVAREQGRVAAPSMNLGCDVVFPGTTDLLGVHLRHVGG